MDSQNLSAGTIWASIAAIVLAVFVPFILWCIYAFRMPQMTMRSILGLAAVEMTALTAIAILARF